MSPATNLNPQTVFPPLNQVPQDKKSWGNCFGPVIIFVTANTEVLVKIKRVSNLQNKSLEKPNAKPSFVRAAALKVPCISSILNQQQQKKKGPHKRNKISLFSRTEQQIRQQKCRSRLLNFFFLLTTLRDAICQTEEPELLNQIKLTP